MKSLNKKFLISSWIITALVIVAVIIINLLAASLTTKFNLKLDLTRNNQYEISDETKTILSQLNKEVRVMVMGEESEISDEIKEYLVKYAALSDNFKPEYIDVYKNQVLLNQYQAKGHSLAAGDIILECGQRYRIIESSSLYNQTFSFEETEKNFSFELESKLTNGIVFVTGLINETAVYFLDGHGESTIDTVNNSLNSLSFKNEKLNLINNDIPQDAGLIISIVPTADFSVDECRKLEEFFDRGGNFMVVFSPGMPKLERVNTLLESWGIVPNYDLVLEKDPSKIMQYEFVMLTDTYGHEITNSIRNQGLPLVSYYTSSFSLLPSNVHNAEVTVLLETTDLAIGKSNIENTSTEYEEGDLKGPLPLSVIAEKYSPKTSRLAVLGSAGLLSTAEEFEGNKEYLSGIISWMTNNGNTIRISPKIVIENSAQITNSVLVAMNYLLVWVIPIIILLAGIIIWIRRRYL